MEKLNSKERRKLRRQEERQKRESAAKKVAEQNPEMDKSLEKTVANQSETEKEAESVANTQKFPANLTGDGSGRRAESGLPIRSDQKLTLRAANWQQKNRVPLEKRVVSGKIVDPKDGEHDSADEIFVATMEALKSEFQPMKIAGLRAGIQLIRAVQMDDHAKLRAELRPTAITPQVVVDQSTHNHTDNRRVMLIIPDNGRDPQLAGMRQDR